VRNTDILRERQQTIGALQDTVSELQPVLRQVGDLERILARLALRTARPRDLARMRHAFQQLPELHAQLETVDSAPVQALRKKMGDFADLTQHRLQFADGVLQGADGLLAFTQYVGISYR
ncbi:hypothetical protein ACH54_20095, partial [Salmonella enterica subsp. enterica serovar Infantis]